ncbi:MAG: HNH endonuclease [Bacteroidales bacterium]|nr:HNH endonuclease [Bacteroidales bacterium]
MVKQTSGTSLSATLQTKFSINKQGLDVLSEEKHRIGQTYFRKMILSIYENKCCITGLCIPEILLASHITEWAKDERNRLNPRNGLCLSATYDSAFDKHLITLDEDYRVIVSPTIKQYYDKASVQQYFQHIEGQRISLPIAYAPDQRLLAKHREQLR